MIGFFVNICVYIYILIDLVPVFYDLKIDYVCFNLEYIINICSSCFVFSIFLTINKLCFSFFSLKKYISSVIKFENIEESSPSFCISLIQRAWLSRLRREKEREGVWFFFPSFLSFFLLLFLHSMHYLKNKKGSPAYSLFLTRRLTHTHNGVSVCGVYTHLFSFFLL